MNNTAKSQLPLEAIRAYCRERPIQRLLLFGSALRDDFSPNVCKIHPYFRSYNDTEHIVERESSKEHSTYAGLEIQLIAVLPT